MCADSDTHRVSELALSSETKRALADSSHGCHKSTGERANLIAWVFMKEKALIYSKSFRSPLWMWSDKRTGVEKRNREGSVGGGDRDKTCGAPPKFTCSL